MARLPDVTLGPVQDDIAPAAQRAAGAATQLGDTLSQGLTVMGQELIKTQTEKAHLQAAQGLQDAFQANLKKDAWTKGEAVAAIGQDAYDKLPDEVRRQVERPQPVLDEKGMPVPETDENGVPVKDELGQVKFKMGPGSIPSFMIAGYVFKAKAQQVLESAAGNISLGSWGARFQRAAQADVIALHGKLNQEMITQAHQYNVDQRARTALYFAYNGDFNTSKAIIEGSPELLGRDGQLKLSLQVQGIQQTRPVWLALEAFRLNKPGAREQLEQAASDLADPAKTSLVDPQHRAQLARQVHAALDAGKTKGEEHDAAAIAQEALVGAKDEKFANGYDLKKAQANLEGMFVGGGKHADRPELRFKAGSMIGSAVSEANAAATATFEQHAGAGMEQYWGYDANGVAHPGAHNLTTQARADLIADGKRGGELLHTFEEWDRQNEAFQRTRDNTPTTEQSAKALAIEYALATNGKVLAALGPGGMSRLLTGESSADLGLPSNIQIPAGRVAASDVKQLSAKFAGEAKPEARKYLVSPESIAFSEAEEAFPELKQAVQRLGKEKGSVRAPEEIRKAVGFLADKLAKFIDANPGPDGRGPDQETIRKEAQRLLQTVEVKRRFWFNAKMPRAQAEANQEPIVDSDELQVPEGARPAEEKPAPAKPAKTPAAPAEGTVVSGDKVVNPKTKKPFPASVEFTVKKGQFVRTK